jgi:hypothetical protein
VLAWLAWNLREPYNPTLVCLLACGCEEKGKSEIKFMF